MTDPPVIAHRATLIAAHRGGAGLRPENSRAAFVHAIAIGVDQIETDLRLSCDGEPVLIHDATLERTTCARGLVARRSWKELRRIPLRGGRGETIPHLDDLLGLLSPTPVGLRLELKLEQLHHDCTSLCARAIRSLEAYRMLDRTTVSSFDWSALAAFRTLARPRGLIGLVRRGQWEDVGSTAILDLAQAHGLDEIGLHASQFSPEALDLGQTRGIQIGLYKVKSSEEMERALCAGASAFTTDRPDLALAIRRALRHRGRLGGDAGRGGEGIPAQDGTP